MPIVYEKLIALKIPDVEHSYGPKDCMLYALGVGNFQRDQLFVDDGHGTHSVEKKTVIPAEPRRRREPESSNHRLLDSRFAGFARAPE